MTYIIKSFKTNGGPEVFTLESEQNGNYISSLGSGRIKRCRDFLCDGDFVINSIIRQNNITSRNDELFSLGTALMHSDTKRIINKIFINKSEVYFDCSHPIDGPNLTVSLQNARLWVEPVKQVKKSIKKTNNTNSFIELQEIIESNYLDEEIRLEATLKKTAFNLGLEGFLKRFFEEWNKEKNTIYVESGEIQTEHSKRRSLGDIYMICKYYFPNCTLTEVLILLYITLPNHYTSGFRTSICNQINKRVWYYDSARENTIADKFTGDEYTNNYAYYLELLNNN